MEIEFDPFKRMMTLAERGLDMARAGEVFEKNHLTVQDDRREYGEDRFISIGLIDGRMVVIAWTPRGEAIRIISMRKANDREQETYGKQLGR
jgi:uncharacterized DUF497 family protein